MTMSRQTDSESYALSNSWNGGNQAAMLNNRQEDGLLSLSVEEPVPCEHATARKRREKIV